ncbi:MAG: HAD-IIIA family hydrolase [Candidatus Aadella gelida]|nr:HAD-IIIA family hydrolase [Candidatus Aadella gelida]
MGHNYPEEVTERAKNIKLLVVDVDGVLTDGTITYGTYGDELKSFNVNDGLGIILVKRAGIKCVILTAKASRSVKKRAKDLKINKVYQNFHYKINALSKIINKFNVKHEEICFIGDDVIDIPVLKRVGLAVTVPNGMEEVKSYAHYETKKKGGHGAVREVCELILKANGLWDSVTKAYFE